MAKAEKSTGQRILIAIAIVLAIACLGVDLWWIYIQIYGQGKTVIDTFNLGQIETVDGSDKKYIFEVNYLSNDNQNGYEMFELKINYYNDEKRQSFYSQGLQFVANSTTSQSLNFDLDPDSDSQEELSFWSHSRWFGSYSTLLNGTVHNYASSDDYNTTMGDFETLGPDVSFRITLKEEVETNEGVTYQDNLYLLKFQGTKTKWEDAYKHSTINFLFYTGDFYSYNDIYYLCRKLYESARTMQRGTSHATVTEFLNLFTFAKYNGSTYEDLSKDDTNKVKADIATYCVIKFNVSADGAQRASDSMFKNIKGSPTFNLTGDYSDEDYYIGRFVMSLNNDMFDKVIVEDGFVALKLKSEYLEYYLKYKDTSCLSITIDKDKLQDEGLEFVGFTADSGLEKLHIKECKTIETIDGEVVESEVRL